MLRNDILLGWAVCMSLWSFKMLNRSVVATFLKTECLYYRIAWRDKVRHKIMISILVGNANYLSIKIIFKEVFAFRFVHVRQKMTDGVIDHDTTHISVYRILKLATRVSLIGNSSCIAVTRFICQGL